jgi:dTDP-4-amino-4,6-dideoxygalactose transaminase
VDAETGNINAQTIAVVLTPRTKAVICVHLAGWPCDMDPIMALAAQHGLKVIEDCAQAHGARYKGRSVGSIGHVGAWSFCQDKIMTTGGEGGMVTCNDESLWRAMWAYKDHGKSYSAVYEREHPPGFRWLHESFGTNWRMLEMQAVIGRIQLHHIADWVSKRNSNAMAIRNALLPFAGERGSMRAPIPENGSRHAYYRYYAYVRPEKLRIGWTRDRILEELSIRGIPCNTGACPEIYLEKAFDQTGFRPSKRLPNAKSLGETSLMFLVHPTLTAAEIGKAQSAVSEVMQLASSN